MFRSNAIGCFFCAGLLVTLQYFNVCSPPGATANVLGRQKPFEENTTESPGEGDLQANSSVLVEGWSLQLKGTAKKTVEIRIACLGDSLTFGNGSHLPPKPHSTNRRTSRRPDAKIGNYPLELQHIINGEMPSAFLRIAKLLNNSNIDMDDSNRKKWRVTVKNFGIPSFAVDCGVKSFCYHQTETYQAVVTFQPHILFVLFGTNDAKWHMWQGTYSFQQSLRTLLDHAIVDIPTVSRIILLTPPPVVSFAPYIKALWKLQRPYFAWVTGNRSVPAIRSFAPTYLWQPFNRKTLKYLKKLEQVRTIPIVLSPRDMYDTIIDRIVTSIATALTSAQTNASNTTFVLPSNSEISTLLVECRDDAFLNQTCQLVAQVVLREFMVDGVHPLLPVHQLMGQIAAEAILS